MNKITRTSKLALIGLMTAIICILGPVSIPLPFSPVPISLTNLAIYFAVFILGWKLGTISYIVYLLVGIAGIPVFSGFSSGFGKLLGPTGGYLVGFLFMSVISGWMIERFKGRLAMSILGMAAGTCVAYFFGTLWLGFQMNAGFIEALMMGVLPYVAGDAMKIILAAAAGPMVRTRLRKAGVLVDTM